MLNTAPSNLISEFEAAEAVRDAHLREMQRLNGIFTGPYTHAKGGEAWPDNFPFQYGSYALPKTAFNNPRFKVKSSQSVPKRMMEDLKNRQMQVRELSVMGMMHPMQAEAMDMQMQSAIDDLMQPSLVAEGLQWALNNWVDICDPHEHIMHFVMNCLMIHGVMMVTQEKQYGGVFPKWSNVSIRRFGFDPLCLMFGEARYAFRKVIRDKDDVLKEAEEYPQRGWDAKVIAALGEDSENSDMRKGTVEGGTPTRGEITYYEAWLTEDLPESFGPDEGFHGTMYYVAKGSGDHLRKPTPYHGPHDGPFELGGIYPVMDSPYPLSPVMANYAQARDHNDQVKAAMAGAKSYKRIVFVPAGSPDIQRKVADSPHDYIVPIKGLKKDEVIQFEIGGVSDQQLTAMSMTREILRRSSGMTENAVGAQEGGGVGRSTATEAAIIDESSATRMAFVQQRISTAINRCARKTAWFMYHDHNFEMELGPEAADSMDKSLPVFKGGSWDDKGNAVPMDDDERKGWNRIGIEIDVMSMPWSGQNQEKQNAIMLLDQVIKVASVLTTAPAVDWKDMLNRTGDAFNESDLGDIIDDAMVQQQMAMEQQAAMGVNPGEKQRASQESGESVKTEQAKRQAIESGAKDKSKIAAATVQEKKLKGKSYGMKAKAAKGSR